MTAGLFALYCAACDRVCGVVLSDRDDITMAFSPSGSGCTCHAFSTSTIWCTCGSISRVVSCAVPCHVGVVSLFPHSCCVVPDAVLDDGTNYCNLHNLVEASGLSFSEDVDTSDCTQYSSANCAKY